MFLKSKEFCKKSVENEQNKAEHERRERDTFPR